ncbi:MAG: AMP-binding protein [Maribacter sp.]|uniref:AMP-binding protein n=1 Tax=Maribacter sp. TaxID=1897614 RepID=UPI00329A24B6
MAIDDVAIHTKFKLNGISYTKLGLMELVYDLLKEGSFFEKSIGTFLSEWLDEKPIIQVTTSGSTGKPKNISLKKKHMANSALATAKYFGLKEGSTALLCLPVDYIAGKMMLVRAMVLGLDLDYVEPSSKPLDEVNKYYGFAAMVPLQLEGSLAKIEMIKTLIVGGAALSKNLKAKIQQKNIVVFETFGMTETVTHVAVKRVNKAPEGSSGCFEALPNVTFATDERECLIISAPKVSDHRIVTNDIVKLISETEFDWLGRYDHIINSGGIKLFPEQIETKLAPMLRNRFFVTGLPDAKLGQKLVLVVEGELDTDKLKQILSECKGLQGFEIPKSVYTLPKFIETDTGKIRRKESCALLNY